MNLLMCVCVCGRHTHPVVLFLWRTLDTHSPCEGTVQADVGVGSGIDPKASPIPSEPLCPIA